MISHILTCPPAKTYISRPLSSPYIPVCNESKYGVCTTPFRFSKQQVCLENRQSINYPTQPLCENQALEVANHSLPRLIVHIRQDVERNFIRKEAVVRRNIVVA
jgi:hypothetical protein